jgi:hypothetical protein
VTASSASRRAERANVTQALLAQLPVACKPGLPMSIHNPSDNSRHRWAILAMLFAARVGLGFTFQTLGSVADPLVRDLHLSFACISASRRSAR